MSETEQELAYLRVLAVVDRKTTNTIRFEEVSAAGQEQVMGYLYIKKKALAKIGNPKMVTIKIEAGRGSD